MPNLTNLLRLQLSTKENKNHNHAKKRTQWKTMTASNHQTMPNLTNLWNPYCPTKSKNSGNSQPSERNHRIYKLTILKDLLEPVRGCHSTSVGNHTLVWTCGITSSGDPTSPVSTSQNYYKTPFEPFTPWLHGGLLDGWLHVSENLVFPVLELKFKDLFLSPLPSPFIGSVLDPPLCGSSKVWGWVKSWRPTWKCAGCVVSAAHIRFWVLSSGNKQTLSPVGPLLSLFSWQCHSDVCQFICLFFVHLFTVNLSLPRP